MASTWDEAEKSGVIISNWDEAEAKGNVKSLSSWDEAEAMGKIIPPEKEEIPTDPIKLTDYIMSNALNEGLSYEEVLQQVAAFPEGVRSHLKGDPWYKQLAYQVGDYGSAPGRLFMSTFFEDGDILETMGKPSETIPEKFVESPAGAVGTAAVPLAGIAAAAALADEAYQNDEANVLDYMVAGTIGAAAPAVGKFVKKLASGLIKGGYKQLKFDELTKGIKNAFAGAGVRPDYADEVLKAHGKEIKEIFKKTGMYFPEKEVSKTAFKKGTKEAIDKSIDLDFKKFRNHIVDLLGKNPEWTQQLDLVNKVVNSEYKNIAKEAGLTIAELRKLYPELEQEFFKKLMKGVDDFYEGVPLREFVGEALPSAAKPIAGHAIKPNIERGSYKPRDDDPKALGALMVGPGRF